MNTAFVASAMKLTEVSKLRSGRAKVFSYPCKRRKIEMNAWKRVLVVVTLVVGLGLTGIVAKSRAMDAVTTHPIKVLTGQALHRLFPIHEEDEAFFAQRTHLMKSYGFK